MTRVFVTFFCLLSISTVTADEYAKGKALHNEHCLGCHSTEIYTRENRIVNSYAALSERVRQCELSNELTWFDEEIEAVVHYLNQEYYGFERGESKGGS